MGSGLGYDFMENAFVFPVVDGRIHLAQRAKEPGRGLFAPAGGKSELRIAYHGRPFTLAQLDGHPVLGLWDDMLVPRSAPLLNRRRLLNNGRLEAPIDTGIRESCEELYVGTRYPRDFSPNDITDVFSLGEVCEVRRLERYGNRPIEFRLHMYFAQFHRQPFSYKQDEVLSVQPLDEIPLPEIMPSARIALAALHYAQSCPFKARTLPECYRSLPVSAKDGVPSDDFHDRISLTGRAQIRQDSSVLPGVRRY